MGNVIEDPKESKTMSRKEEIENYKKHVKAISNDKDIIPGIHNYCDRWCEKCTYTKYCSVFKMEQIDKVKGSNEDTDLNNQKFWDQLSLTFDATLDMISEEAKKLGIDLDEVAKEELFEQEKPKKSDAEMRSYDYGTKVFKWLKANKAFFESKGQSLLTIGNEKVIPFTEALEVVNWYSIFISAKIHRAFHNSIIDFGDPIQNDNNGSAKIALMGIERSMEALSILIEQIPEKEDEILDFLISLAQIKRKMENQFPDAAKFIRPGFDDEKI